MKTIFDFSPTEQELKTFGINETPEKYKAFMLRNPDDCDSALADIYRLLSFRGDEKNANFYLSQIKNEQYRFDTSYCDIVD